MNYGPKETPQNLRRWIYKGGAAIHIRIAIQKIDTGCCGEPLQERIELVKKIHEALFNRFDRGARRSTIISQVNLLNLFFKWADAVGQHLELSNLEQAYRCWGDSLIHRTRIVKDLSERIAYGYMQAVGQVFDMILDRSSPLVRTSRVRYPKSSTRAISTKAEKQSIEEAFSFGHLLLDLSDALNLDAIWGPLPLRIKLRNGMELEETSSLKRLEHIKPPHPKYGHQSLRLAAIKRARWVADTTVRTRYPLINLRIMAEMFMLMAQPGINLAQAHTLRMDQWRFKPSTLGYEVRTYKHRRLGPVVFEIYSDYREIFERYLNWRKVIFPQQDDGLLFPLLGKSGHPAARAADRAPDFTRLVKICARAGVKYVSPRKLRNLSVNWMLRRSQDPELTATEKQHSKATLLNFYEKPSEQRAMVQIKMFWAKHDPSKIAPGIGICSTQKPKTVADKPAFIVQPDCITPTGCFYCTQLRDVDSFDHIWSLVSFRLLKSFELKPMKAAEWSNPKDDHPAESVVKLVTDKLTRIEQSSMARKKWVQEALLRIEEGRYHPTWNLMIERQ